MVLKKPYVFLIRHFKLIHLLLCIPFIYLIVTTTSIASFLNTYVNANYYTNEVNIAGNYINYFMYFAIIFIILLSLAIYFLMKQKEKDTKFYTFIILYYVFLFVIITITHTILNDIESSILSAQTVMGYRDVAFIICVPQFFFTGYSLLRGIGFDIKKFNFEEDVKELEITDIDSEEFELVFGKDAYKYKRNFRRFLREFKYYVLENKFTFSILASFIVIILGTLLYLNFGVYNKTYRESQTVNHNNLTVSVVDSVLTNLDIGGDVIERDKFYMAVALKIKNKGKESVSLDYENFQLEVSKRMIMATLDKASYFPDLGFPYTRDTKISPGEEGIFVLTYEIDPSFINQTITLKILDAMTFEIGSVSPIYKTVYLDYDKVFDNTIVRTVDFGKIAELSNTRLGLTQVQIKDYDIVKNYEYSYNSCNFDYCQDLKNKVISGVNKTLLVLDRMYELDPYSTYASVRKGNNSFVSDFITLKYVLPHETKTITVNPLTPKELQDKWIFEVPMDIYNAVSMDIYLTIRGSTFKLKLK